MGAVATVVIGLNGNLAGAVMFGLYTLFCTARAIVAFDRHRRRTDA
jgi:hypothetical protein